MFWFEFCSGSSSDAAASAVLLPLAGEYIKCWLVGWWQRHHGLKEEGAQRLWGPTVKWSMEVSRGYNKNSLNSLLLVRFDLIKEERSPAEEAGKKLPRHCQPSRVVCVLKGSQ